MASLRSLCFLLRGSSSWASSSAGATSPSTQARGPSGIAADLDFATGFCLGAFGAVAGAFVEAGDSALKVGAGTLPEGSKRGASLG